MFLQILICLQAKRNIFYRKSEILMSLLISGQHIGQSHQLHGVPIQLYKLRETSRSAQTWDLGRLYIYESSVTFHFLGFFRSTVSKLFFHCVTVKQRITNPLCSSQFGDYALIPHVLWLNPHAELGLPAQWPRTPYSLRFWNIFFIDILGALGEWVLANIV